MDYIRRDSESGISSDSSGSSTFINPLFNNIKIRDSFIPDEYDDYDDCPLLPDQGITVEDDVSRMNDFPKCQYHRQKCLFFCNDCKTNICEICVYKEHGACTFKPVNEYVEQLPVKAIREDEAELTSVKNFILSKQRNFNMKTNFIKNNVNKIVSELFADIERKREEIISQIDTVMRLKTKSWRHQMELCDWSLMKLKKSKMSDIKSINVVRSGIFHPILNELAFIEDDYIDFAKCTLPKFKLGDIKTSAIPKFSTVTFPDHSLTNTFNYCSLTIKNHLNQIVKNGNNALTIQMFDGNKQEVYVIVENMKNGKFKIWYFPLTKGYYTLNVYLKYLPVHGSPFTIKVIENKNVIKSVTFDGDKSISRPWGICTDFEGRIIITDRDNHCVKIFQEDGTFIRKFGKEGSGPGELLKPAGVAIDRVNRRILVADKDNHRIQSFSYEGNYVFQFGKQGNELGCLYYPWDIAVSSKGTIAVSDTKNRRVQLFNENGAFVNVFNFKTHPEVELPRGLAFGADESLFVTDFNRNKIVLFSKNFTSIKILGWRGSRVTEFQRPQSIDIDENGRIAVADCNNHRIQVFNSNGKILCVLGSMGTEAGQLQSPQGLCFLPDGRIAVCEQGNNRVQIFTINYG